MPVFNLISLMISLLVVLSCAHQSHKLGWYHDCVSRDNNWACAQYFESPIQAEHCESYSFLTTDNQKSECNSIAKDGIDHVSKAFVENVVDTCNEYALEDCEDRVAKNLELCDEYELDLACGKKMELREIWRKTQKSYRAEKLVLDEANCRKENMEACVMAAIAHVSNADTKGALKNLELPLRKNYGPALPVLHRVAQILQDKKLAQNAVNAGTVVMIDECDVYGGIYCHAMTQLAKDCDPEYIPCKKFQIEVGRQTQLMSQRQAYERYRKQQLAAQQRQVQAAERAAQAQQWQVLVNSLNQLSRPAVAPSQPTTTNCRSRYNDFVGQVETTCDTH